LSVSGLPFDDIRELIANLPPMDERALKLASERSDDLRRHFGFADHEAMLCEWLAGWSGKSPNISRPMIALFAGTHAVAETVETETADKEHSSAQEETLATVTRMAAGGAPVNQVCATHDIGLKVFDLALQYPVNDISKQEALDEKGSAATIGFGMEAIAGGVDILGLGAFGKGSEIANAAMLGLLLDQPVEAFLAHLPVEMAETSARLAQAASEHHQSAAGDPLELLRRLGGREHSALTGAILAARVNHVPVVLDGMTAVCVAAVLERIDPQTTRHCLFASQLHTNSDLPPLSPRASVLTGLMPTTDASAAGHAIAVLKSLSAIHSNSKIEMI